MSLDVWIQFQRIQEPIPFFSPGNGPNGCGTQEELSLSGNIHKNLFINMKKSIIRRDAGAVNLISSQIFHFMANNKLFG